MLSLAYYVRLLRVTVGPNPILLWLTSVSSYGKHNPLKEPCIAFTFGDWE